MDIFSLVGKMKLDGQAKVNQELDKTSQTAEKVQKGMKIMGAAMTAVGAAGLKMVASSRQLNAILGQTAITIGVSTKEMRDMALGTTDVTFRLKSVADTFEILARAGIRNKEEMKASALAFDTLADATGSSAEVLADTLIPAFKNFGLAIPKTVAELDKFTWLTKNTIIDLSEFGSMMSYVAQYGANLDLTLEEMIGVLAALDAQGKSSSTITKMFRTAVTQAASGTATFEDALGLTQEEIGHYITEMEGATGITVAYKKAADEQYTIMNKLSSQWEKLTLVAGSFLTPLEPILVSITALGPLMIGLSMMNIPKLIGGFKALTGSIIASTAALGALIAGIGMIGYGVYKLRQFDKVKEAAIKYNKELAESQGKFTYEMIETAEAYMQARRAAGYLKPEEEAYLLNLEEHIRLAKEQREAMIAVDLRWDLQAVSVSKATDALEDYQGTLEAQGKKLEENIAIMDRYMAQLNAVSTYGKETGRTAGEVGAWAAQYLAAHPEVKWGGSEEIGKIIAGYGTILPQFQGGGVVPGPIGTPVPVIAHGGEEFLGSGVSRGGDTYIVNIGGSVISERELKKTLRAEFIDIKNRNTSTGF